MINDWRIDAVGDRCVLVGVGTTADQETSARVHVLVQRLRERPIAGVWDIVPAFTTVALHYLPERFAPRTRIPPGTVAIARDQTCIYPLVTPGGWNLIGRTPLRLSDPAAEPPSLLRPGDAIRFVRIAPETFQAMVDRQP